MNPIKPSRILIAILLLSAQVTQAQMSAHFINVGQAESILLEFKTAAILIDAGGEVTGDDRDRDHLIAYLNTFFARRCPYRKSHPAVKSLHLELRFKIRCGCSIDSISGCLHLCLSGPRSINYSALWLSRGSHWWENLALRQQLVILRRNTSRPGLRNRDRLFWVVLSHLWRDWRSILIIVKPETVIKWHRQGFKCYWDGGPQLVVSDARGLIWSFVT